MIAGTEPDRVSLIRQVVLDSGHRVVPQVWRGQMPASGKAKPGRRGES